MAENAPSAGAPDAGQTSAETAVHTIRPAATMARADVRRMERAARRAGRTKIRPLRTAGTLAAVLALLAGVAIPAYAATQPEAETVSMQDAAESEAQSIAADASIETAPLAGSAYSATTPEEIATAKAEAAAAAAAAEAAERAREQAEQIAAQQSEGGGSTPAEAQTYDPPVVTDGGICPLPAGTYYVSRSVGSGHEGADMVAPAMTPIYAVKSGTVITSQESLGGWGVTVAIDHGDGTTTLYGHMTYGTRQVEVGQTVEAGTIIGYVGSTGRSTANHLHIEYRVNGAIVDPLSYLPI